MTNPDTKFRTNMQQVTPVEDYALNSASVGGSSVSAPALASQARSKVSQQLHGLAQTVRERGDQVQLGDLATRTAGALERSGSYLQQKDVAAVREDLTGLLRRHSDALWLAGLGLGFLLLRGKRR